MGGGQCSGGGSGVLDIPLLPGLGGQSILVPGGAERRAWGDPGGPRSDMQAGVRRAARVGAGATGAAGLAVGPSLGPKLSASGGPTVGGTPRVAGRGEGSQAHLPGGPRGPRKPARKALRGASHPSTGWGAGGRRGPGGQAGPGGGGARASRPPELPPTLPEDVLPRVPALVLNFGGVKARGDAARRPGHTCTCGSRRGRHPRRPLIPARKLTRLPGGGLGRPGCCWAQGSTQGRMSLKKPAQA